MILNFLRRRATPYYHLPGYMMRWWLVPYRQVITRTIPGDDVFEALTMTDGTGPVSFWRRPIAWCFQRFDIAIRIHDILRSDTGRDPHDHPWPFISIVLRSGYWETRYDDNGEFLSKAWHGPGSVMYRPAGSWHRLDLPEIPAWDGAIGPRRICNVLPVCKTATTLFITGKKAGTWGFNVDGVKVPHNEYLKEPLRKL